METVGSMSVLKAYVAFRLLDLLVMVALVGLTTIGMFVAAVVKRWRNRRGLSPGGNR